MDMTENEKIAFIKVIECEDGSHTLYREDLNEHYHSVFGAVSESKHIFINAGYAFLSRNLSEINILELGFGTGLNAFLTLLEAKEDDVKVNYTGVESIKLPYELISKLNYSHLIKAEESKEIFDLIHKSPWDVSSKITSNFILEKIESKIEDVNLAKNHFNLVYFDAFAPAIQSELWTVDIFRKIYNSMVEGAILTTYSCKGDVKRALRSVGFSLEKLPGPKGKREFLRATK